LFFKLRQNRESSNFGQESKRKTRDFRTKLIKRHLHLLASLFVTKQKKKKLSENKKKLEKVKNFSRQMEPDSEKKSEEEEEVKRKKNDHREQHREAFFSID
jgi:flagellar motor protein MotB